MADLIEDLRGESLAPGTGRRVLKVLQLVCKHAVQADLIQKNPTVALDDETRDLLRGARRPARFLTVEQLARLLDEAKRSLAALATDWRGSAAA